MNFSEKDRQIYTCPHLKRAFDPLAVRRILLAETRGRFSALCGENTEASRAALTSAARKAFSCPPIAPDGSGVLDAIVWESLIAYTRWLTGKGPRAQTPPNSVPSTDSQAPSDTTRTSP